MTSVIRILISITLLIAITREVHGVGSDTDWSNTQIETFSETLSHLNLVVPKYNDLDEWMSWLLRSRLDPLQTSVSTETTITEPIASIACQHEAARRNPRQTLVKIRGEYGGSSTDPSMSLTSYSSAFKVNGEDVHPIRVKHWILQQPKIEVMNQIHKPTSRNRYRRSTSSAETSTDKNITATASLTLSNNGNNASSAIDCVLSLSIPVALPTQFMEFWFKYIFKIML